MRKPVRRRQAGVVGMFGLPMMDRYLLQLMGPPMAAALGVVLIALLLERILRLFNLLAASSARFELILDLVGNLVPHYLGLALPAAFFISVFLVIARLGDNNEVDALLAPYLAKLDRSDVMTLAEQHGILAAPVVTPAEALRYDHLATERGFWDSVDGRRVPGLPFLVESPT